VSAAIDYAVEESGDGVTWTLLSHQTQLTRNLSKPNGTWRYRVQACNAGGCGPYSGVHAITIALITPGIPTGLTVSRTNQNEYCTIRWNAVAGATLYKVSRASYNGPDLSTVHTVPCLPWYTVAACNANGCSAESARASASGGSGGVVGCIGGKRDWKRWRRRSCYSSKRTD